MKNLNQLERMGIQSSQSRHGTRTAIRPVHKSNFRAMLLSAILAISIQIAPAFAEEAATTDDAQKSTTQLTGTVQIDTTLNDLRDARLGATRVRKAAANLYDEMTRQQVTMMSQPNMVGNNNFSIPRPVFGGYLPPRPKWVKEEMAEIAPIIKLFKEDVDAAIESNRRTEVDDSTRKTLDSLRTDVFARVQKAFEIVTQLEPLTGGPTFENTKVAELAKSLDEEMKQLDRSLKRGMSVLQRAQKGSKKSDRKSRK
jgi:hypothetical protein